MFADDGIGVTDLCFRGTLTGWFEIRGQVGSGAGVWDHVREALDIVAVGIQGRTVGLGPSAREESGHVV